MEKLKKILKKLLFPHIAMVILLVPIATVLLIYALALGNTDNAIAYLAYFLSAYALTILCARSPYLFKKAKAIKQENKYIKLYTSDAALRVKISLYGSLGINVLYAIMQLGLGIYHHSVWFYALAGYYVILALMRFFLLREARKGRLGQDLAHEFLLYRLCGIMLLLINIVLSVIVTMVVWVNRGFEHHAIVTIAMAAYTFYTLTMAFINIIRYRRYKSPVMSSAKALSLVAAMVSMLSLETAMLTAFSTEENTPLFRQIMTGCTGAVVCAAVLAIAVHMIVYSTKRIRELREENQL